MKEHEFPSSSIFQVPTVNNFVFKVGKTEIEISEEGFKYNGELIKDSQEIYNLFKNFLNNINTPIP